MIKRGACYIRVSTNDQLEFSPDAQLKAIKKYAKDNDIIIDDDYVFIDEGISGRKASKRPAFQQMIKIAKSKPISNKKSPKIDASQSFLSLFYF